MVRKVLIVASIILFAGPVISAQRQAQKAVPGKFRAEYTVSMPNLPVRTFLVTATFSNIRGPYLDVALPVWTPGVYTAANYALNVRRFTARDKAGKTLRAAKIQPSTWRIEAAGNKDLTVEFNYIAQSLSWNGAAIMPTFAFFTGTQLFLEPVGHRISPATVRFVLPAGWKVASALRETPDPLVFRAANYDELVDSPTVMGSFDVTQVEAEGKRHFLIGAPAGAADCKEGIPNAIKDIPKIVAVQRAIFGSLPYDKYVVFCIAEMDGGAVEHGNSFVSPGLGPFAHEFFHLWNVKRIRPAEMWPYDYSRVNPGPSLWVSEGITSYYATLTEFRAGIDELGNFPSDGTGLEIVRPSGEHESMLLQDLANRISQVEGMPERRFVSPSDASMSDGLAYGASPANYYSTGNILGAMLDLSILHDTKGRRRLDDVMRSLYTQFYEKGRGFRPDDLVRLVSATAGKSYADFFRRHVTGTEDPPFEKILGYAGYRVSRTTRSLGVLGGNSRSNGTGYAIYGNPARGLRVGDVILAVDGVPISQVPRAGLYGKNWIGGWFIGRAGERVVLRVLRDGTEQDMPVTLGTRNEIKILIEKDPAATPEQLLIRNAWLKR